MFRRSTENEHQYQYDEDMGPETDKKISARQNVKMGYPTLT